MCAFDVMKLGRMDDLKPLRPVAPIESEHVPEPLVMVTLLPEIEQAPPAVIIAVVLAVVVAATVNVDWYAALAGAPVKFTADGGRSGSDTRDPERNP